MNADSAAVRAADAADAVRLCATLTPRERDALVLLSKGAGVKAVGTMMGISKSTVEVHSRSILRKMGANKMIEAAVIAAKAGLV